MLQSTAGLTIHGVSKAFPGVQALSDVDLHVEPGRIHGLVGENGAGKSTMMAVAAGIITPDTGEVTIGGEPLRPATPRRARTLGLAIVRQEPALLPDLSVAENLCLGVPEAHRPRPGHRNAWARRQLTTWGGAVPFDIGTRVAELVPEHRFLVEITKAFAAEPVALILDEPTEHLAAQDTARLFEHVRRVAAAGTAVVYISHRIREVRAIAGELTILRDGRVVAHEASAGDLSEQRIIDLIVGRPMEMAFPDRPDHIDPTPHVELVDFAGPGFAPITMTAARGEIVGLAGVDGNGQKDFLRALAGRRSNRGHVRVDGRPIVLTSPSRALEARIAHIPGDRHREGILPDLSVRENVALRQLPQLSHHGLVRRRPDAAAARSAVARYGIRTPDIETPISSLSGGNQQKSVLAGVLATKPRVLLAEEPTQGVDVGARVDIYTVLREAADAGTTVFLLSSDSLELAGLCDRVMIFSRGQVVRTLDVGEVAEHTITEAAVTATTVRERRTTANPRLLTWLARDSAPGVLVGAVVTLLGLYAAVANDAYLTHRNLQGMLTLVVALGLAGIAQQFVMMTGGIDLSVGPLMGLLVVVESYYLVDGSAPAHQALGWLLLFAIAAAVGLVNWFLVEVVGLAAMVATLATYMALQGIALTLRPTPGGLISVRLADRITTAVGFVPVGLLGLVAVAVVLQRLLRRSLWGLSIRAVGSRPDAAFATGVNPALTRLKAYLACSLFAALAAIPLLAQVGSGVASAGNTYTLGSVAAAVIGGASIFGGRGSFVGPVLGALLIQQVATVTAFLHLTIAWQSYLLGGMIIVAVAAYSRSRRSIEAGAS
ncbi:ATP-binding cassette domain-containing protein [Embleya hyalina]|uniref:Sugar ABC transporter ATP-binding protein n=1 Tax=Embleya hyalina TaxID=516124 RepID=A0A401YQV4_9ACTN|nr:ATP-binding cassette domain-containing protein [Embleya hyalina]GCD96994.1 sugar ABC transporter ATP-binding protein [Embleya hyalina]